jgi:hypothetical protein
MKSPPTTSKEQLRNAEKQFKTTLSHCCLKRQGVSVGEFCHCRGPGTVGLGGWRICGSWWPWVAKKLKNFSIPCRAEMGHDRGWWIASILASEWISDLIIYFILFFIWFNFSIWFIQAEKKTYGSYQQVGKYLGKSWWMVGQTTRTMANSPTKLGWNKHHDMGHSRDTWGH